MIGLTPKDAPLVIIAMGSPKTDGPIMQGAEDLFKELLIPHEVFPYSAHRTLDELICAVRDARARGAKYCVAGAGGAAHLPGVIAGAVRDLFVIGVPIQTSFMGGIDSLLSIVQMPAGVPVACVAVNGAKNAALLAALGLSQAAEHIDIADRLGRWREKATMETLKNAKEMHELGIAGYLVAQPPKK